MRRVRAPATEVFNNPILIGTITILIIIVGVYLSYIAENGLPFVPTYNINVQVASAAELVKNADVRIGGARVGQVLTITPEPATPYWPHPYALLKLSLEKSLDPLPRDTRYQVRLASVLGGKYVELRPGNSRLGLPDGATLRLNTNPALSHDIPFVDIDKAFDTFGPATQRGLRSATQQLGTAVAGRGTDFNDAIRSTRQLMDPLLNLLRLLASPRTHLSFFIHGLAATTSAFAPVAHTFSALLADGATTFTALNVPALGTTIEELPPTEAVATTVLTNSVPTLQTAATIVQDLKPASALLPASAKALDQALLAAPPVFKLVPGVASGLESALGAVNALAQDPASIQTFQVLGSNDLGTFGASAFVGLGAILNSVASEQFSCNLAGLWVRGFASALSEGDSTGSWLRFMPLIDTSELYQTATPSPDLHLNYYPIENTQQCQAGNEVYSGKQLIGNPPKTTTVVDNTVPPPGVLNLGKKAGLVP
jgi:virulence factor Mce-like protein